MRCRRMAAIARIPPGWILRRAVIELTVEAAAGRVPVVAGTGALSTRETVELSLHAERAGATAVMVVPPFYEALGWRELLAHYTAVAEAIAIPIMYYNLPSASGVKLDADQLRELQRVARVTSLKDTGGDAVAAADVRLAHAAQGGGAGVWPARRVGVGRLVHRPLRPGGG